MYIFLVCSIKHETNVEFVRFATGDPKYMFTVLKNICELYLINCKSGRNVEENKKKFFFHLFMKHKKITEFVTGCLQSINLPLQKISGLYIKWWRYCQPQQFI